MIVGLADTHTALWHLLDDKRLSSVAGAFLLDAAKAGNKIAVSSISLAEVVYLVDKRRVPSSAYEDLVNALADPEHLLVEATLSAAVVHFMREVPRSEVPDMPDRIVAATAIHLGVPVISRDRRIRAANLTTIW
jgi:PIN domain nuclease of toxin-antitoxin system